MADSSLRWCVFKNVQVSVAAKAIDTVCCAFGLGLSGSGGAVRVEDSGLVSGLGFTVQVGFGVGGWGLGLGVRG